MSVVSNHETLLSFLAMIPSRLDTMCIVTLNVFVVIGWYALLNRYLAEVTIKKTDYRRAPSNGSLIIRSCDNKEFPIFRYYETTPPDRAIDLRNADRYRPDRFCTNGVHGFPAILAEKLY